MPCNIKNPANIDLSDLEPHINGMYDYFDQKIGFNKPPTMVFDSDPSNQHHVLGKTAYYDPSSLEIHVYSDGRHPKDMLRSIAHELIHHKQNLEGRLDVGGYHGEGYYLENKELKKLEQEAMLKGNGLMREYEDTLKLKEKKEMSLNEWKNNELNRLLMKKFGILKENKKQYDLEENQDRIFAPNHYCAHHVVYEGKKGQTVDHNWNESLQKVTKYDVKFEDGTIIRNIHESKLTILEAFTEVEHSGKGNDGHPPAKKDDDETIDEELKNPEKADLDKDGKLSGYEKKRGKAIEKSMSEKGDSDEKEELDEGGAANRTGNEARDVGRERMHTDRVHENKEDSEEEEKNESLQESIRKVLKQNKKIRLRIK